MFGYVALVLAVTSFLQKNDIRFKSYLAAEFIAYVVNFTLLGNPTAAASSLVAVTRSVMSIYSKSVWIACVFVAVNLAFGFGLAKVWWNWLPLIATSIGALAVFLLRGIPMRLGMLVGASLSIANNIMSGSIGGSALEIVITMINIYTIDRFRAKSFKV